jgi:methylenetetrahydrofolate dehydrogenase (NADP+)/methenyltetrahydrofolate cyclohydrolase
MNLLKSKKIAEKIKKTLKKELKKLKIKPCLAVILVGKNSASEVYVKIKEKTAKEIGVKFKKFTFPSKIKKEKIIKLIRKLNQDEKIDGILVQLPLPKHLNPTEIVNEIDPKKDVDGFLKGSKFTPPVYQAIYRLLRATKEKLKNKKTIIVSKNKIFAEPLKKFLAKRGLKAEILYFPNINFEKIKKAKIVIVALGKVHFLKPKMINKNSIIIDVGYSRIKNKIAGDVDPACLKKTKFLTPVPGGIGPLTVVYLFKNLLKAHRL